MTPAAKDSTSELIEVLKELHSKDAKKEEKEVKTWPEFCYKIAKDFGIMALLLGGILTFLGYLVLQTLPKWVDSNIETQARLTETIDKISESQSVQTKTMMELKQIVEGVDDAAKSIAKTQEQTIVFMKQREEEHLSLGEDHKAILQGMKN